MVNDVVNQTKIQNIPGILVQLYFCKAFDTIEWSFIKRSLALFDFGDSIQQWVSTLYNNSEPAVHNDGFCTNFFKLLRGVRQSCPLSLYLFIVGAEIFTCKIRQDKTIKEITVFQKELKLIQFADDTTLLCSRAITVLNSFGNLSGLRLNPSKTNSALVTTRTNPLTLSGPKNRLESLEPTFHTMRNKTRNLTLKEKCKNLTPILGIWNSRNLTLFGKCLITKSLGISQLVHLLSTLDFLTQ